MNPQIQEFKAITNQDDACAQHFLSAANGNLERALELFFSGEQSMPSSQHDQPPPKQQQQQQQQQQSSAPVRQNKPRKKTGGGMFTFKDLQGNNNDKGDFVGGSSTSGTALVGAPSNNMQDDIQKHLMDQARQHGPPSSSGPSPAENRPSFFGGSGNRLGSQPSMNAPPPTTSMTGGQPTHGPPRSGPKPPEVRKLKLTFWKDGFSIDDQFFSKANPDSERLLQQIKSGVVPSEFSKGSPQCDVSLVDRNGDVYKPPKKKFQAFKGSGRTMTSSSPTTTSSPSTPHIPTSSSSFSVDPNQPTTNLQLRLPNQAVRQQFNTTHTIGDIHAFLLNTQTLPSAHFQLMTTFPRKVLSNMDQTIADAGLQNAALVINFKT